MRLSLFVALIAPSFAVFGQYIQFKYPADETTKSYRLDDVAIEYGLENWSTDPTPSYRNTFDTAGNQCTDIMFQPRPERYKTTSDCRYRLLPEISHCQSSPGIKNGQEVQQWTKCRPQWSKASPSTMRLQTSVGISHIGPQRNYSALPCIAVLFQTVHIAPLDSGKLRVFDGTLIAVRDNVKVENGTVQISCSLSRCGKGDRTPPSHLSCGYDPTFSVKQLSVGEFSEKYWPYEGRWRDDFSTKYCILTYWRTSIYLYNSLFISILRLLWFNLATKTANAKSGVNDDY